MMNEQLTIYLQNKGYQIINSNLTEFTVFYCLERNFIEAILLVEAGHGHYVTIDQYEHLKEEVQKLFHKQNLSNLHIISLIISEDNLKARKITGDDKFSWILNSSLNQLVIYEDQVSDFYGLKNKIEEFLKDRENGVILKAKTQEPKNKKQIWELLSSSYVTAILIGSNIFIFILCTMIGEVLYNKGMLDMFGTIGNHQWYRLLTSMFLHGDSNHLLSNLLSLYAIGSIVERKIGHIPFAILYLLSGIGGGILSLLFRLFENSVGASLGASGAIFGVIGALLVIVIWNKGRIEHVTLGKILFVVFYSLYSGFIGSNVDNAAHIGGMITGICCMTIFCVGRFIIGKCRKSKFK